MSDTPTILFETTIQDWRLPNEAPEELSGRQTEDWRVKIEPGGYGGLFLTFTAPDGAERCVSIEIDKGNVTLGTYRGDEQDAKMTISADASYVHSGSSVGRYGNITLRYDSADADIHDGEIPECFADEA